MTTSDKVESVLEEIRDNLPGDVNVIVTTGTDGSHHLHLTVDGVLNTDGLTLTAFFIGQAFTMTHLRSLLQGVLLGLSLEYRIETIKDEIRDRRKEK